MAEGLTNRQIAERLSLLSKEQIPQFLNHMEAKLIEGKMPEADGEMYSDKLVVAGLQSTDEEFRDFADFTKAVDEDEKLRYVMSSALGFPGMQHGTVLNIDMGGWPYVFNSVRDMQEIFDHLGIEGDFSECKHRSMIISTDFAKNYIIM